MAIHYTPCRETLLLIIIRKYKMSKFQLEAVQVQVITTEDGKQFDNMDAAVAHQALLDAAAVIATPVEAYLNARGFADRNRKQKESVISDFAAYLVGAGVDLSGVEAVERTVFDTPKAEKVVVEGSDEAEATDTPAPEAASEDAGEDLF